MRRQRVMENKIQSTQPRWMAFNLQGEESLAQLYDEIHVWFSRSMSSKEVLNVSSQSCIRQGVDQLGRDLETSTASARSSYFNIICILKPATLWIMMPDLSSWTRVGPVVEGTVSCMRFSLWKTSIQQTLGLMKCQSQLFILFLHIFDVGTECFPLKVTYFF